MLSLMDTMVSLVVKVLWKFISLICFRVYLEVNVYKNPTCFSRWSVRKNVKIEGSVPVVTDETADGETVREISLPALSNKELPIDESFEAVYKIDYAKVSPSVIDAKILTTAELVSQAYCVVFTDVVTKAVKDIMDKMREKAPSFEGETIIPV